MHQLPFTALLNHLFAGPVTALLTALGFHPAHPAAPIPDHFAMEFLVFMILIVFFVAVRASLSVEKPEPSSTSWKSFTTTWIRRAKRSSATPTGAISRI